jgi:small-conductance mechanosensitive channel
LIILASRPFKIGDRIAILSSSIPFQASLFPAYKFFSRDYVIPAFTGVVKEMGLMYTTLVTDELTDATDNIGEMLFRITADLRGAQL